MAVSQTIQEQMLKEAYSATPNYSIDYSDPRFGKVESDKSQALTELEQTYSGMISGADKYYDAQIQASKDWADKQSQIQQEQTDFAIEQINQQKEQAQKDYLKEQSGAYVDWQKQSNQYGVNAEQMASAGLTNTGFAESSQVSMYNTYQNRVAVAREAVERSIMEFNNNITQARLQNNAALAELYFQAHKEQLELALSGFQYKNQLVIEQANKKIELDNMYHNRYQDVLQQINTENAIKEDIRQYNETMAWNTEQAELDREFKAQESELDRKHSAAQAEIQRKFQEAQAELDRKHDKELLAVKNQYEKERLEQQHQNDLAKLKKQQEYELAQLDKQLANEKALLSYKNSISNTSVGSVSGGSGSKKVTGKPTVTSKYNTAKSTTYTIPKGTSTKTTSSEPKVNMKSVMALGYGSISASKLASLVSSGEVLKYTQNGETYFMKNPRYYATKLSLKK